MGCNESKNVDQAVHQKHMLVICMRKDKKDMKTPRKTEKSHAEIDKRVTNQEEDDIKEPFLLMKAKLYAIKEETESETESEIESFYSADLEHNSEKKELLSSQVH
ncbi:hypothetical protein K2173_018049 [Erythroxylum novogranatense]|uniref:Uncharacterized protein n=1 Tax=Erythroxylum novogranatense TaxID=1862640 RepID=A0AAV8TWR7_9ROSI|nr:hypothetical protein K2173_018049 [Erythroxylum novogranatense]